MNEMMLKSLEIATILPVVSSDERPYGTLEFKDGWKRALSNTCDNAF